MKKYVWIAISSFTLGLLLAGYVFLVRPEKAPATASGGQVRLTPSQVSATSHTSPTVVARHTVLLGSTASGGQVLLVPSQ